MGTPGQTIQSLKQGAADETSTENDRISVAVCFKRLGCTDPADRAGAVSYTHLDVYKRQRLMNLDSYTSPEAIESLSSRLWRRYDQQAFELLAEIREDPRQAEILIKGTDYIRCEIRLAKHQEMIIKLEDFLRRRSKIALVVKHADIQQAEGLMEACEILFGDQARGKYDEYFQKRSE